MCTCTAGDGSSANYADMGDDGGFMNTDGEGNHGDEWGGDGNHAEDDSCGHRSASVHSCARLLLQQHIMILAPLLLYVPCPLACMQCHKAS